MEEHPSRGIRAMLFAGWQGSNSEFKNRCSHTCEYWQYLSAGFGLLCSRDVKGSDQSLKMKKPPNHQEVT